MMKIANFATAAVVAIATLAAADRAAAKDDSYYDDSFGLAIFDKYKKKCIFVDKEYDKVYEAKYARIDYVGYKRDIKLTCYFDVGYLHYPVDEEDFKCKLVLVSYHRPEFKRTDDSRIYIGNDGKGKMECKFEKKGHDW